MDAASPCACVNHAALKRELQAEHGLSLNGYEALYVLAHAEGQRLKRVELPRLAPADALRSNTPARGTPSEPGLSSGSRARPICALPTPSSRTRAPKKLKVASCGHVGSIRTLLEDNLSEAEIEELSEILGKLPDVAGGDETCAAP